MILVFHVLAAVTSLLAAGALYLAPSKNKLHLTYLLTGCMLTSGTYLVIQSSSHLLQACIMGLGMLSVIAFAVMRAHSKLAHTQIKIDS